MRSNARVNGLRLVLPLIALLLGAAQTVLAQGGGGFGGGGFGGVAGGGSPKREPIDVEELQRQYPFRSYKKRLAYELKRTPPAEKPRLSEAAAKHLKYQEDHSNYRIQPLELLHSDQVDRFVNAPGFGTQRMTLHPAKWLPPPKDRGRLKLDRHPSAGEDGPAVTLPVEETLDEGPGIWSPSQKDLLYFAYHSEDLFANPMTLGYVKSLDRVAGFEPHAFLDTPTKLSHPYSLTYPNKQRDEEITHRWELSRLELVSLLKQPKPRVYVSEFLPRMQDLNDKATRPLTELETKGLEQLRAGEDLHVEAQLNTIRMVGALRARKQCIECHQVERGEVLGAFSYELRRVPPLPVPKRRPI